MNRDLTQGKAEQVLWLFCLPLFGSVIFQQMYNIADSLVVGKFVGESALAAVGNSYEITLIFIAFAFGCNMGCSVIAAQFFGAKDYNRLKTAIYTALISSAVLTMLLMVFGITCGQWMLEAIHTPAEIMEDSAEYLRIYIWGLPFLLFYNVANGIFSSFGDSRTPFLFLVFSSCSNILVDIYFVKGLGMGVAGVAWATFLCQGLSCILAMTVVLRRVAKFDHSGKIVIFSWTILEKIAKIAVPSILQQGFISLGNIIIQSTINDFGATVTAGYSAGIKLNNLVISSFTTIGNGVSNYTAQNLGAGKMDRIRTGFKAGVRLMWTITFPFVILYLLGGRFLLGLFVKESTSQAITVGLGLLRIVVPFYFIVSVKLVSDGILRGMGYMKIFMIGTFTDLILRVVLSRLFSMTSLGVLGIWTAWPVGWTIATAISVIGYRRVINKKRG